jgi:hypothetical protein
MTQVEGEDILFRACIILIDESGHNAPVDQVDFEQSFIGNAVIKLRSSNGSVIAEYPRAKVESYSIPRDENGVPQTPASYARQLAKIARNEAPQRPTSSTERLKKKIQSDFYDMERWEHIFIRFDFLGRGITGEFNFLDINGERISPSQFPKQTLHEFLDLLGSHGWEIVAHQTEAAVGGAGSDGVLGTGIGAVTYHYMTFKRRMRSSDMAPY